MVRMMRTGIRTIAALLVLCVRVQAVVILAVTCVALAMVAVGPAQGKPAREHGKEQSQPGGATQEDRIAKIKQQFATVRKELHTYRAAQRELLDMSAEGGTLKAYYKGNTLKLIEVTLYGETGRSDGEYYYDDSGRLFFAFQKESRYDKPFGRAQEIVENRLYFHDGRLIRWLGDGNVPVAPHTRGYAEREKEVRTFSETLREVARGTDTCKGAGSVGLAAEPFRAILPSIVRQTEVPVLLPSCLPGTVAGQPLYAEGEAKPDGYAITLTSRPDCGANACLIGVFKAQRGGSVTRSEDTLDDPQSPDKEVTLVNGIRAYYKPLICGGSCSPPIVEWISAGILYHIQFEVQWRTRTTGEEEERHMVQMANSSITAGAR